MIKKKVTGHAYYGKREKKGIRPSKKKQPEERGKRKGAASKWGWSRSRKEKRNSDIPEQAASEKDKRGVRFRKKKGDFFVQDGGELTVENSEFMAPRTGKKCQKNE